MSLQDESEATFSIHACDRCRKRKAKCDPGIPSCRGCLVTGSDCVSTDAKTRLTYPRSQIVELEHQISRLEERLRLLGVEEDDDAERLETRGRHASSSLSGRNSTEDEQQPDLICVESRGDGHFLGASSGLHLARSVLESARKNSAAFYEHDASGQSEGIQEPAPADESNLESDGTLNEVALPSWETVSRLVDVFFRHYEIQYPILDRDKFTKDISSLYFGTDPMERIPRNPRIIFMLNMVLSISLTFIDDPDSTRLAERFRHNATTQLSIVMQAKSHQTLQCLLLLLLSSTLGSKSAPMWYISGICMRMCVDLGYHSEKTICQGDDGQHRDDDPDTKRRLFWVTYTFDRSLAKMLGRPFFIDDERIDVIFPTTSIPPHAVASVHHWLTMQRIQSEIVSHVYALGRSPAQTSPLASRSTAWANQMEQRLGTWFETTKRLERHGRYTAEWWEYWYQHARLMLNQPKPRATKKSLIGAFDAAETMVRLSFIRAHRSVAEFSWLDIHLQLVSGLTMLFLVLKSPHLRERAQGDWLRFKGCVIEWEVVLEKLVKRWRSMMKMKSVLSRLADGVLDSIENNKFPEGHPRRHLNSPRRNIHDTRFAMEELSAPLELARRIRSPHSASQPPTLTRKRRRGVNAVESPQGQRNDPSPASVELDDQPMHHMPLQHTENGYYPWFEGSDIGTGALGSIDFPSVLGGELFTDIDQLGAPLQLDLGLFDQPTHFMAGADADPLGFQWLSGRADATLTDSVLNFRGGLEEPQHAESSTQYPAHYE